MSKLSTSFGFPTQWSLPRENVYGACQPEDAYMAERKYQRLRRGHILNVVELVSVINVLQHCLRNLSPNGYILTFSANQGVDQSVPSALQAWLYI